jgi:DNA-binding NarL/FixJ family response regulator
MKSGSELSKIRVLLADDCAKARQQLRAELQRLAFVDIVGEAGKTDEALDLLLRTRPDLVLAAICLPEHGGFHILRSIEKAAYNCAVILMTRSPSPFVNEAASLLGAAAVCPTKDGFGQLIGMIQRLRERRSGREA